MKQYLEERLDDLRRKYRDTGDSKWYHRFNECKHILEKITVDEIASAQAAKRSKGGSTSPSTSSYTSLNCDGGLDPGLKWGTKAVKFTHEE